MYQKSENWKERIKAKLFLLINLLIKHFSIIVTVLGVTWLLANYWMPLGAGKWQTFSYFHLNLLLKTDESIHCPKKSEKTPRKWSEHNRIDCNPRETFLIFGQNAQSSLFVDFQYENRAALNRFVRDQSH